MALHIKKIMDDMIIVTFIRQCVDKKASDQFVSQVNKLVYKGYRFILVDLTNVYSVDEEVMEDFYELQRLLSMSGGTLKVFGVHPEVLDVCLKSEFGNYLNLQTNEVIEDDSLAVCWGCDVSWAS